MTLLILFFLQISHPSVDMNFLLGDYEHKTLPDTYLILSDSTITIISPTRGRPQFSYHLKNTNGTWFIHFTNTDIFPNKISIKKLTKNELQLKSMLEPFNGTWTKIDY